MVPFWTEISLNGRIFQLYFFKIQLIWNKKPQGSKGLEDVYQWGNTSQNFASAEPATLHKADNTDWRLVQTNVGLYYIHGSKSIDLNESLADIDEFSILFVCLSRSVRGDTC